MPDRADRKLRTGASGARTFVLWVAGELGQAMFDDDRNVPSCGFACPSATIELQSPRRSRCDARSDNASGLRRAHGRPDAPLAKERVVIGAARAGALAPPQPLRAGRACRGR